MTAVNTVCDLGLEGGVAVLTVDSPPVNALSAAVRDGIYDGMKAAMDDPAVQAIVLLCAGRTFIAGADIAEFGGLRTGKSLPEVQALIETSTKPVIAAIHGTALGGGLELALACHYRVALPSARCGLPEVKLGLVPGAGGTQRLPRIVGPQQALEMVTSGQHVQAAAALAMGLIDELATEDHLREDALRFAHKILAQRWPLKKVRDLNDKVEAARGRPEIFAEFRAANAKKFRGFEAPESNIRCIEAAVNLPFDDGLAFERKRFLDLVSGAQSAAQRHVFFAERQVWKIPDVTGQTPILPIRKVGVIGAGTMGGGIAMNFASAGLAVTIVETQAAALDRGLATIRRNYETSAKRGKLTEAEVAARVGLITGALELEALADCDLIVEAVFERMDIKKAVFTRLDSIAKPGAILATNTSYLDIDEIAGSTGRPESVIGLHFFSPANVMRLLEVVRGEKTSLSVVATAMQMAKTIGKIGVVVGVCHGFVGNRMLAPRQREAEKMVLEGATPWDVDRVLFDFGFPMGPFAMRDLAGLDVGWVKEQSRGDTLREILCEMGRLGQKSGAGFYDYDSARTPSRSALVDQVIDDFRAKKGVRPRLISDDEILERCLYPVVNEGAKILDEKKAARASDIDIVWVNGYGWPAYRGGPMWWAGHVGLGTILARMKAFQQTLGDDFKPSAFLEKLAAEGAKF